MTPNTRSAAASASSAAPDVAVGDALNDAAQLDSGRVSDVEEARLAGARDQDVEYDSEEATDTARELRLEEVAAAAVYDDEGAEEDNTRKERVELRTKLAIRAIRVRVRPCGAPNGGDGSDRDSDSDGGRGSLRENSDRGRVDRQWRS